MIRDAYKNHAGIRDQRFNRISGGLISLYDGAAADMDTDGGRWQTVCETHGTICSHDTIATARSFLTETAAENWCEPCAETIEKRRGGTR